MPAIRYTLDFRSSKLIPEDLRLSGAQAWILCREVFDKESRTSISFEEVAIFNFDSEAMTFMRFLAGGGTITVPDNMLELVALEKKHRG